MIALLQRVRCAEVRVANESIAAIEAGLVALIAAERRDDRPRAHRLAERVLDYRLFADANGRMNRSARATGYGVLAVPQFTLAADTRSGNRPGFSHAAEPETARALFAAFARALAAAHARCAFGRFGADMQLALVNDGPVTFWISV